MIRPFREIPPTFKKIVKNMIGKECNKTFFEKREYACY